MGGQVWSWVRVWPEISLCAEKKKSLTEMKKMSNLSMVNYFGENEPGGFFDFNEARLRSFHFLFVRLQQPGIQLEIYIFISALKINIRILFYDIYIPVVKDRTLTNQCESWNGLIYVSRVVIVENPQEGVGEVYGVISL